jgi:hypothetical protein
VYILQIGNVIEQLRTKRYGVQLQHDPEGDEFYVALLLNGRVVSFFGELFVHSLQLRLPI